MHLHILTCFGLSNPSPGLKIEKQLFCPILELTTQPFGKAFSAVDVVFSFHIDRVVTFPLYPSPPQNTNAPCVALLFIDNTQIPHISTLLASLSNAVTFRPFSRASPLNCSSCGTARKLVFPPSVLVVAGITLTRLVLASFMHDSPTPITLSACNG